MRLTTLKIENLRSYRTPATLSVADFTAVIGRNDVGKSTLLEALEIFFNHQTVKLDQQDPCVHNEGKVVEISCVFDELPATLTLDAHSQTTLSGENLLNAAGKLEIVKRFDCKPAKPKEEVFARALFPTEPRLVDLLKLKNAELKTRAADVEAVLEGVDKRSNAALRRAIRAAVDNPQLQESLVGLNEEDGKKAWEQIQREMPTFALFQADRPSKDDDPEVADPMKIAVAAAVKEVEADLEEIKEKVRQSAIDVATRTLAKLREIDPRLAQELTPTFKAEPKWDGFKLSLSGDNQIPINKRGSGVRRMILLSFFRAEAERRQTASNAKRVIYAVEEPESSQHPDSQAALIKALLALADDPNTQVLITTHVPGIAAMIPTAAVRLITHQDNASPLIEEGTEEVFARVADTLGVTPDRRARVAVFVEGPNDVEFLTRAARLHRAADATLLDFDTDQRVVFVPTGGGNLQHWVDKRYLQRADMVEVHIYDCDDQAKPKYKDAVDAVNARGTKDVGFYTSKRELENYIHHAAIQAEFGCAVVVEDWNDVPDLVAEQVHVTNGGQDPWVQLAQDKKDKKIGRAKRRLNAAAMARMSLADLQARDPGGEIKAWFEAIRDRA